MVKVRFDIESNIHVWLFLSQTPITRWVIIDY